MLIQMLRTFQWLVLAFGVSACSQALQTTEHSTKEKQITMSKELDQLTLDLKQADKHKAIKSIESVVNTMTLETIRDGRSRKQDARGWLRLIHLIKSHEDPNFDRKRDAPMWLNFLFDAPQKGVQESKERAKARAEYEAAVKNNEAKIEPFHFQFMLPRLEARATWCFKRFLNKYYADTAADRKELYELLAESGASDAEKQDLKAAIGNWDGKYISKPE